MEEALYWSECSVYTSSVARAYFLPFVGVEGAGEGGRSFPERSSFANAAPSTDLSRGDIVGAVYRGWYIGRYTLQLVDIRVWRRLEVANKRHVQGQ